MFGTFLKEVTTFAHDLIWETKVEMILYVALQSLDNGELTSVLEGSEELVIVQLVYSNVKIICFPLIWFISKLLLMHLNLIHSLL